MIDIQTWFSSGRLAFLARVLLSLLILLVLLWASHHAAGVHDSVMAGVHSLN